MERCELVDAVGKEKEKVRQCAWVNTPCIEGKTLIGGLHLKFLSSIKFAWAVAFCVMLNW